MSQQLKTNIFFSVLEQSAFKFTGYYLQRCREMNGLCHIYLSMTHYACNSNIGESDRALFFSFFLLSLLHLPFFFLSHSIPSVSHSLLDSLLFYFLSFSLYFSLFNESLLITLFIHFFSFSFSLFGTWFLSLLFFI